VLAVPLRHAYAFALRARNVDASLNPKYFLWKPICRVRKKSVALRVPCHAEKACCSVCLPPSATEERANGAFFIFFSGNRCCFHVISVFSCACVAVLSDSRALVFGQAVRCWQRNSLRSRRGGNMPTYFRSVWGY